MTEQSAKHPGGRPTKFTDKTIEETQGYMLQAKTVPSVEGLSRYMRVSRSTIYEWAKHSPEFSDMLDELLSTQAEKLIDNGLTGEYNAAITKLMLAKHGYNDKQEIEVKGIGDTIAALETDYDEVAREARKQMVALNPPIQD